MGRQRGNLHQIETGPSSRKGRASLNRARAAHCVPKHGSPAIILGHRCRLFAVVVGKKKNQNYKRGGRARSLSLDELKTAQGAHARAPLPPWSGACAMQRSRRQLASADVTSGAAWTGETKNRSTLGTLEGHSRNPAWSWEATKRSRQDSWD